MAQCLILESFKGSQDGRFATPFEKGQVAELSDYLMGCAPHGSFKRIDEPAAQVVENKATITKTSRNK